MRKVKKIILWVLFAYVLSLIVIIGGGFNVDSSVQATAKDLSMYKLTVMVPFIFSGIGIAIELFLEYFRNKITSLCNVKLWNRIIVWVVLMFIAVIFCMIFYLQTSQEFRNSVIESINTSVVGNTNSETEEADSESLTETETTTEAINEEETEMEEAVAEETVNLDSPYGKLNDDEFALLTAMIAESFYTFTLDNSSYEKIEEQAAVMDCLKQIYNYAYDNLFELDPDYRDVFAKKYDVVTSISSYDTLQDNFEIEYNRNFEKNEWVYTISSYSLDEKDVLVKDDVIYIDGEGYLQPGVTVYWLEDNKMEEVGVIKDIAYDKTIDGVAYGYALNIEFKNDPDFNGWRDGESFLTTNKKLMGDPLYYVNALDANRSLMKEAIDYDQSFSWNSLGSITPTKGMEVYMGVGSTKKYMFTITDLNEKMDMMHVSYPSGSTEIKSYSEMMNNESLYIMK